MGIDIELFLPVERNQGKEAEIIRDIIRSKDITTYEIKRGNIEIHHPEPSVDYDKLKGDERWQAQIADYNRPEYMAVSCYGLYSFAIRPGFIRISLMDRWKLFFTHFFNRKTDLQRSLEIARHFSNKKFYLVPDESDYFCFGSTSKTRKEHFQIALKHPSLVTVVMHPELAYKPVPLPEAIEMLSFRANPYLMRCLEDEIEP